ncbi:hypothetical protein F444_20813 [Phytophthora nicotianae P1976]|uniref:Uncharacterized protein n=1 Tax=Phytophthora nicotianae P1976 TaxID=1317066 RepID=A0A080Z3B1_PHYNI|nr:hypothetical protein F444_20813 [Phytophthora nicotianae P1976]
MSKVFEHCDWKILGYFDPVGPLSIERSKQPEVNAEDPNRDRLGFTEIEEA